MTTDRSSTHITVSQAAPPPSPIGFERLVIGVDDTAYTWDVVDNVKQMAARLGVAVELMHATTDPVAENNKIHDDASKVGLPLAVRQAGKGADSRAAAILNFAKSAKAVPVVTSHGRGALTSMVVGSTTAEVLRRTDRPVLVYGPAHDLDKPISRVVACLDGTDHAERIIVDAARWAVTLGVPFWVVEVFEPSDTTDSASRQVGETNYLHRVSDALPASFEINWDTLHGKNPGEAIVAYVNEEPGTLTAMATHGRSGVDRLIAGSVTEQVIHETTGPLLIRNPHTA